MTCPDELALAMHADDALMALEAMELEQHLAGCERCRARVGALREESRILGTALADDTVPVTVPAFVRPVTLGTVLAGAAATLFVATALSGLLGLLNALLPEVLTWFNPLDTGGIARLVVRAGIFLTEEGDAIAKSLAQTAGAAVVVVLLVWIAVNLRERVRGPFVVAVALCVAALRPMPADAIELRHSEDGSVFVAADETVDDTLIALGETVEVNGNVAGDLIAFARRVVVRGNVAGFVITAGESLSLDGSVDSSVIAAGETLNIESKHIGRNFFGAGETVTVGENAGIGQNAMVAGEKVSLAGHIERDVLAAAESLEVASSIGRTLTAYTSRMAILAPARINGDVNAHGLEKKDHVVVSPGAVIGGKLVTQLEKLEHEGSRYQQSEFYFAQLLWLAAAFVTGFGLLALAPRLRRPSLRDAGDALRTAAFGIVALVATPIIAVLVCLTIIGIPLGLIALALWGASIYLAKVAVAQLIGTHFIEVMAQRRKHFAVALLFGLLVVTLVTNLPFIGGVVRFLLTILGLGLLVLFLRDELRPVTVEDD